MDGNLWTTRDGREVNEPVRPRPEGARDSTGDFGTLENESSWPFRSSKSPDRPPATPVIDLLVRFFTRLLTL